MKNKYMILFFSKNRDEYTQEFYKTEASAKKAKKELVNEPNKYGNIRIFKLEREIL